MTQIWPAPGPHAELNRRACARLAQTLNAIIDRKGYASLEIARLGGPDAPRRQLKEYRVGHDGSWINLGAGDGSCGTDMVSLLEYLASCSRDVAAAHLADIVDRLEREEKAA